MTAETQPIRGQAAGAFAVGIGAPHSLDPSLVMLNDPTSATAEAVRALRTHLMAQHVSEGRRAVAVCAASEGVGCSFIAANLGVSFSQIGVKTLFIDADLRHPSGNGLFGHSGPHTGLAQCLADSDESFGQNIQGDVQPNLSVMFAGGTPANPQELLAGDRFTELMDFCLREYDVTVVDTPPANTCSDARRISTVTGYSLIVARRNLTYVEDVRALAAQLEADHARVIGTVMNDA